MGSRPAEIAREFSRIAHLGEGCGGVWSGQGVGGGGGAGGGYSYL